MIWRLEIGDWRLGDWEIGRLVKSPISNLLVSKSPNPSIFNIARGVTALPSSKIPNADVSSSNRTSPPPSVRARP